MRKAVLLFSVMLALLLFAPICKAEPTLDWILNQLYGSGNWGPEITNDQIWYNPDGSASATAKYAGFSQNFGYEQGISGGSFVSLFNISSSIDPPNHSSGYSALMTPGGYLFRWMDQPSGASPWSSKISENIDLLDHMKTFLITGGSYAGSYAIAWEDTNFGGIKIIMIWLLRQVAFTLFPSQPP